MPQNQAIAGNQTEKQADFHLKGTVSAPLSRWEPESQDLERGVGNRRVMARAEIPSVRGLCSLWRTSRTSAVTYGSASWETLPRGWTQDRGCHLLAPGIHASTPEAQPGPKVGQSLASHPIALQMRKGCP